MPNLASIQKAADRRKARQEAKQNTAEQVAAETIELSRKTEEQSRNRPATATRVTSPSQLAGKGRKAKNREAQERAQEQAEADVRVEPDAITDEVIAKAMEKARMDGTPVPLHILNAQARINDRAMKDDAREMATAVGQVAYEQALGRTERNKHTRQKRMNEAMANQRRIEEAKKQQA